MVHFSKPKDCPCYVLSGINQLKKRESEEQTAHMTQQAVFSPQLQRALTNTHSSPPGNLVDARLGLSLHVIAQIHYIRAGLHQGDQSTGSGLAHVTVICGGHRRGTQGSKSDTKRWHLSDAQEGKQLLSDS